MIDIREMIHELISPKDEEWILREQHRLRAGKFIGEEE